MNSLKNQPLVSIIINCKNGEKYLKETIDSIYKQKYLNFEIIYFDNNSKDSSLSIAQGFDGRLKIYKSKKELSLGEARNEALSYSSGEYICYVDSDDSMLPNRLENQVNALRKSKLLWSFGGYNQIDSKGKILKKITMSTKSGIIFKKLLKRYFVNFQTVMFKRELTDQISPFFDKNFFFGPDYNLIMILSMRFEACVIRNQLINYRVHSESLTNFSSHLFASEYLKTNKNLMELNNLLGKDYEKDIKRGESQYYWLKTLDHLINKNTRSAKDSLRKIILKRFEYFLFFIILSFPFGDKIFMKLYKILKN